MSELDDMLAIVDQEMAATKSTNVIVSDKADLQGSQDAKIAAIDAKVQNKSVGRPNVKLAVAQKIVEHAKNQGKDIVSAEILSKKHTKVELEDMLKIYTQAGLNTIADQKVKKAAGTTAPPRKDTLPKKTTIKTSKPIGPDMKDIKGDMLCKNFLMFQSAVYRTLEGLTTAFGDKLPTTLDGLSVEFNKRENLEAQLCILKQMYAEDSEFIETYMSPMWQYMLLNSMMVGNVAAINFGRHKRKKEKANLPDNAKSSYPEDDDASDE